MRKQLCLMLIIIPFAAYAQKDAFMDEFNRVNNRFFAQPKNVLVQKYLYYNDSAMISAVDSSVVVISKNNTAIDYTATGLESFSDSGFMIKINHAGRYMIISKIAKTDTGQLRAIFSQGFSAFTAFTRTGTKDQCSWTLSGGTEGVDSAKLSLDLKLLRVSSLEMFMAGNHPLVSAFKKAGQTVAPTAIIKVEYQYPEGGSGYQAGTLSDFIAIDQSTITPAAKYKDYRIKLATEKNEK